MIDILLTRLKAHSSYMAPRIHGDKKRIEFIRVMNVVIENIRNNNGDCFLGIGTNKHGGLNEALIMCDNVYKNTDVRFGTAERDSNFYLERL